MTDISQLTMELSLMMGTLLLIVVLILIYLMMGGKKEKYPQHNKLDCPFCDERHQTIYLSIMDLYMKNAPVDLLTVLGDLKGKGLIDKAGGATYINELMETIWDKAYPVGIPEYIKEYG